MAYIEEGEGDDTWKAVYRFLKAMGVTLLLQQQINLSEVICFASVEQLFQAFLYCEHHKCPISSHLFLLFTL